MEQYGQPTIWDDRENKETTIDLAVLIDTDLNGFK